MKQSRRESACSGRSSETKRFVKSGVLLASLLLCDGASAFVVSQRILKASKQQVTTLRASPEDEIARQLERARELLAKSKAKLEATGDAEPYEIPFFATSYSMDSTTKREKVTKSRNEETGLITADGEKMARISENEQWEMRSLQEVFENEIGDTEDVTSMASKQLAERDVAASIFNLRKQMKTEDYRRIFDTRNHFIGEDT